MKFNFQAATILLPLALALPTPEVAEAPEAPPVAVPVTEEPPTPAPADGCWQVCPPEC